MRLEIRLFTGLKCQNLNLPSFGQEEFFLEAPEGLTVQGLHDLLEIKSKLPLVTLVNGLARNKDYVLQDNDRIGVFPPVGGG